jgi:hypothetical protein
MGSFMTHALGAIGKGAISLVLLGLLTCAAWPLLGPSFDKDGTSGDQFYVDAAIQRIIQAYPPSLSVELRPEDGGRSTMVYARPEHPVPYTSVQEFRAINPTCCTFAESDGEGNRRAPLAHLLGDEWRIVRVSYRVRYTDERGMPQSRPFIEYVMLRRDGEILWIH